MIVCRSELLHQLPDEFIVRTPSRDRRIRKNQCSGLSNDRLLKIYTYITDACEASLNKAIILHQQQEMLHDALMIYATLPNNIKNQLSNVWPCCYAELHRIPLSASNPAGLIAYKKALSAPLVEFWDQHVEKLSSLLAECPEVVSCYHEFVKYFQRSEAHHAVADAGAKSTSSVMDGSGGIQASRTQSGFQFSGKQNDGSIEVSLSESHEDPVSTSEEELAVKR